MTLRKALVRRTGIFMKHLQEKKSEEEIDTFFSLMSVPLSFLSRSPSSDWSMSICVEFGLSLAKHVTGYSIS